MNSQRETIIELRRVLEKTLVPLINNDYVYWELPYYSNVGDPLIWLGTESMLKKVPYNCLDRASMQTCTFPNLSKDVIILLQGGGNFGDLWREIQDFRLRVVEHYPNNKIIVLPQTVFYNSGRLARKDSAKMREHKNLTICTRDRYSYHFLRLMRFASDIRLVPDMAFCIDMSQYHLPSPTKECLFLQRTDKENNLKIKVGKELSGKDYEINDWITFDEKTKIPFLLLEEGKTSEDINRYAQEEYMPTIIQRGIGQVSNYNCIYTSRLHGAILALLMEKKKIVLIDNAYGKNRHFYQTWLRNISEIKLVKETVPIDWRRSIRMCKHILLSLFD